MQCRWIQADADRDRVEIAYTAVVEWKDMVAPTRMQVRVSIAWFSGDRELNPIKVSGVPLKAQPVGISSNEASDSEEITGSLVFDAAAFQPAGAKPDRAVLTVRFSGTDDAATPFTWGEGERDSLRFEVRAP